MLKVSNAVKTAYFKEEADRHLVVTFPEIGENGLTLQHSQIRTETMQLTESILDQDSIEFIGCISSQFKLTIDSIPKKLKGKKIVVSVYTDDTATEPVKLFTGTVDSDERTGNKRSKEIVAYDAIYSLTDYEVTDWFNTQVTLLAAGQSVTIKQFRTRLFKHLGITQVKRTLPADSWSIRKLKNLAISTDEETEGESTETGEDTTGSTTESTTETEDTEEEEKIYAIDLIKAICQINGRFGIMNRSGKFDYRKLGVDEETDEGAYPGVDTEDSTNGLFTPFIPGTGVTETITEATFYPSYRSVSYEDYEVHGITRVYVRQDDKSRSGYFGENKKYRYFVQGNRFTLGTTKTERSLLAALILSNVKGVTYTPFTASCTGLPYLEVGDPVSFYVYDFEESDKQGKDVYALKSFYVLSRTLKGIQSMTDTLSAQGEEKQRRFVSDLGVREDVSTAELKEQLDKNTEDISSQGNRINSVEEALDLLASAGYVKAQSVPTLPSDAGDHMDTIYLIKGTVG